MTAGSPSAALGAAGKPDVSGAGAGLLGGGAIDGLFRFRRGEPGAAVMSRFKFVGKRLPGYGAFRFPGIAHRC